MAAISFRGVDKVFDDGVRAVEDLHLEVREGELLVLLGPSGCGKTTVLRMLAGLEDPTEGAILVGERRVDDLPPGRRDVAMIFQNYALYPHKSVYQNLAFPLRMRRVSKPERDRRIQEVADLLDLTPLLDKRPSQLSGGQQQRVAIGRALVREPAAFLMDEPLSNLDAQLRSRIRSELGALQRRLGITTIFVTHDQTEAMTLGDRIAVMREGRLQQVGTPDELYHRPANLFVAWFVGQPSMNLLGGIPVPAEGGTWSVRLQQTGEATAAPPGQASPMDDDLDSRRLTLPPSLSGRISQLSASTHGPPRRVVLGLRPEALSVVGPGAPEALLTGRVRRVESLGPERLIHVETTLADASPGGGGAAATVIVRTTTDPRAPLVEEPVGVTATSNDVHLFGSDGRSLGPSDL